MSFWEKVKDFGEKAINEMQEKQVRIMRYKEQFERFDDKRLIEKYKSSWSSQEERFACGLILKERGYSSNNK